MKKIISLISVLLIISNNIFITTYTQAKESINTSPTIISNQNIEQLNISWKDISNENIQQIKSLKQNAKFKDTKFNINNWKIKNIKNIYFQSKWNIEYDSISLLKEFKNIYKMNDPENEIKEFKINKDKRWYQHSRMKQYYEWIPVLWGEFIVHKNNINQIEEIDSNYFPWINISTIPSISKDQAINIGKQKFQWENTTPKLIIYPFWNQYVLTYEFTIINNEWERRIYINANNWKILNFYNQRTNADALSLSWYSSQITWQRLIKEWWDTVVITWWYEIPNNTYYLLNTEYSYYIYDEDSNNFSKSNTSNFWSIDPSAISAAKNVWDTLKYLYNTNWFDLTNSFYASNQYFLPVIIHQWTNYVNAYFSSIDWSVNFWDWDWINASYLSTLDVTAHEIGHFVTSVTSDLTYNHEAWALDESFSDITAVNIELDTQPDWTNLYPNSQPGKSDWLIWEDTRLSSPALRDMRNPKNIETVWIWWEQPTRYKWDYWYFWSSDNWWVHYNNSVQNFFYYLLVNWGSWNNEWIEYNLTWIWLDAAKTIAFDVQTNRLLSSDWYSEARQAWINSANALYPQYVNNIEKAWDAVWVSQEPNAPNNPQWTMENINLEDMPITTGWSSWVNWSLTNTWYNSQTSLKAGTIWDSEYTFIQFSWYTNTGYISFNYKVSSEPWSDILEFLIDWNSYNWRSGQTPWGFHSEYINAWNHTFTWKYTKDISLIEWTDTAYIDNINFPSWINWSWSINNWKSSTKQVNIPLELNSINSSNYQITWNIVTTTYTGTVQWTKSINIDLSNWDWNKNIYLKLTDRLNKEILNITGSILLDTTWPEAPTTTTPQEWAIFSWNSSFAWNTSTDSWVWLSWYNLAIATDSWFSNVYYSGNIFANTKTITGFTENTYYWKVRWFDNLWNLWDYSAIKSFIIDKTAPAAPTNVVINNWNIINTINQYSISITWNWPIETWASVLYTINNGSQSISWTNNLTNWSFNITWINISWLWDGNLWVDVKFKDLAWNIWQSRNNSITKDTLAPTWTITFLSGSYTNLTNSTIRIHSSENANYIITGDIAQIVSWSITGDVNVNVQLNGWNWIKTIYMKLTDIWGTTSQTSKTIILDQTNPTINITSHTNNQTTTAPSILLVGSASDNNWISNIKINGTTATSTWNWQHTINLNNWLNTITITWTDLAWNSTLSNINIIKISTTSNINKSLTSSWNFLVTFNTNIATSWVVLYWTTSSELNLQKDWSTYWTNHSILLTNLNNNSTYYFKVYWKNNWYNWESSQIYIFKTPSIINPTNPTNENIFWSIILSWHSNTWFIFNGSKQISISNTDEINNSIKIITTNLQIIASWWNWDWIIQAPENIWALWSFTWTSWYNRVQELTFRVWNQNTSLIFSGWDITINLYVWSAYNWKNMKVYVSNNNWTSFSEHWNCIVANAICTFKTTHFSEYTLWLPINSSSSSSSSSNSGSWGWGGGWWYNPNIQNKVKTTTIKTPNTKSNPDKDQNINKVNNQNIYNKLLIIIQKVSKNNDQIKKHIQILLKILNTEKYKNKYNELISLLTEKLNSLEQPNVIISNDKILMITKHTAPNWKVYVIRKTTKWFFFNTNTKIFKSLDEITKYIDINNKK